MPFIAFLGCDGSGKSAVIHGVTERLRKQGHSVTLGHWRPKPFARITSSPSAADDPHGRPPRGAVSSILKLVWLWLNWWVAWLRFLRRDAAAGYVIFDRYHGDLIADPRRYRYGGPMPLARLASRLMPRPDIVIFLDAPASVLFARKQELDEESLGTLRKSYLDFIRDRRGFHRLDAGEALETVINRSHDIIVSHEPRSGFRP